MLSSSLSQALRLKQPHKHLHHPTKNQNKQPNRKYDWKLRLLILLLCYHLLGMQLLLCKLLSLFKPITTPMNTCPPPYQPYLYNIPILSLLSDTNSHFTALSNKTHHCSHNATSSISIFLTRRLSIPTLILPASSQVHLSYSLQVSNFDCTNTWFNR